MMKQFIYKITIYLLSFVLSMFGLNSLDFSKFLKKNKVSEAWILYFILACGLAYLLGSFIIQIMYSFN